MKFERKLITPSIAKEMLEANIKNRRIKQPRVNKYYNAMINGHWKEDTGEAIKISKTNVFLDGQHRFWALIKANKSYNFLIVSDLEDTIYDVLDSGSPRNASDAFKIESIKGNNQVPSIIQLYYFLKSGNTGRTGSIDRVLSVTELLEKYHSDSNKWDAVFVKTINWYRSFAKVLKPSLIGALYSLFYDLSPDDADRFMEELCTGMNVSNNVVGILRNKLIRDKTSIRHMKTSIMQALIIKSWNYYRKNETPKALYFNSVEEKFPIAI